MVDLINRVEEQEALVVQNVRRPKTRLDTLVDDATLRTRTKALQLQVLVRAHPTLFDAALSRGQQVTHSRSADWSWCQVNQVELQLGSFRLQQGSAA